jgi:hypothetical protein
MSDWRTDRVLAALEGRNPTVLAKLDASFAVIGDVQFLRGYSLTLTNGRIPIQCVGVKRVCRPSVRAVGEIKAAADSVLTT